MLLPPRPADHALIVTALRARANFYMRSRTAPPSSTVQLDEELSTSLFAYSHAQSVNKEVFAFLQRRLGRLHAKLRLGIEADHEAQVFGQGINYFHIKNFTSSHFVIRTCLRLTGLYWRGRRNAAQIEVRQNYIRSPQIPKEFDGYTILQLSDLHVDMSQDAMTCLTAILKKIDYDLCVLTGDYRGQSFGSLRSNTGGYVPDLRRAQETNLWRTGKL